MTIKSLLLISLTLIISQLSNAQTFDQQKFDELREQTNKKHDSIGKKTYKLIENIQEALQQRNNDKALAIINEADKETLNSTELAMFFQLQASAYTSTENYKGALTAYKHVLDLPPSSITMYKQLLLVVGQLYANEGDYNKGLEYIDLHFNYEKYPRLSIHQIAFSTSLMAKDYIRAMSYVDIAEGVFNKKLEKQTDERRIKMKESNEQHQLALTNMRAIAQRGLDGEDIMSTEDKGDPENGHVTN